MRVSVEHKQEKKDIYVTTQVLFSAEEQATIKERGLEKMQIIEGQHKPPATTLDLMSVPILKIIIVLSWIGVPVFGLIGNGFELLALLCFVLALGLTVWASIRYYITVPAKVYGKSYSVYDLLRGPLVLYARDPAMAKVIDAEIKDKLSLLKTYLDESKEIKQRESYEL